MQRQRAPSAARFDDGLAGLQPQLPADEIHLRHLRLLERHVGMVEVGAGVEQLVVEPARVEVVAEVVVVMHVPARLLEAVRALHVQTDALAPASAADSVGKWLRAPRSSSPRTLSVPAMYASPKCRCGLNRTPRSVRASSTTSGADCGLGALVRGAAVPQLQAHACGHQLVAGGAWRATDAAIHS